MQNVNTPLLPYKKRSAALSKAKRLDLHYSTHLHVPYRAEQPELLISDSAFQP
jgi:hypothetical protein